MNTKKVVLLATAVAAAVAISLLLISALAAAQQAPDARESDGADTAGLLANGVPSVTFTSGDWPWYAHQGIAIHPEPFVAGRPSEMCAIVINKHITQTYTARIEFGVGDFGINVPFEPVGLTQVTVPPGGEVTGCIVWIPPDSSRRTVQARLVVDGFDDQIIQRNLDMEGALHPLTPQGHSFVVRNPATEPLTIGLGLISHPDLSGWGLALSDYALVNMGPGELRTVVLTVTPPADLPTGWQPIVDVEAYIGAENVGGFRKMDFPPVPIHKPHEKGYAESEISTVVYNTSDVTMTVKLEFGWAKFGMGIPFSTTGIMTPTRWVTLAPGTATTVSVPWTPAQSGHQCVRVLLSDAADLYDPQESQRNVDVEERAFCGTNVFSFTVYNDSLLTATVDIGLITFNVPEGWEVSTIPSDTLELAPFTSGVVIVVVKIPCPSAPSDMLDLQEMYALQQEASSVPTVDVEGYVAGDLVGGIELQFSSDVEWPHAIYLPVVMREN
jgi:hypothetical protein